MERRSHPADTDGMLARVFCPKCGTEAVTGAGYCRACGNQLQAATALARPATPPALTSQQNAHNSPGTAGGVIGIVGFVLSWIPLLGILIGLLLGIIAIVLGGVGLSGQRPKGMAITGLVLGIVTVVLKLTPIGIL